MAAAPARLAEEHGGSALWRDLPDGGLEVATVRDGWLYRHLVREDGTATVIDSAPPPSSHRWAIPLSYTGFGICILALLGSFIGGGLVGNEGFAAAFLLFGCGMAVMAVGVIANALETDIARRVKWTGHWYEAAKLGGWVPTASAQLTAVERLADKHGGVAYVRDFGASTVDVVVKRKQRVERYSVDQSGFTQTTVSARPSGSELVIGTARFLCFPLLICIFIVAVSVHGSARGALIFALAVADVAALGVSIASRSLHRFPPKGDAFAWLEVRTWEEHSD